MKKLDCNQELVSFPISLEEEDSPVDSSSDDLIDALMEDLYTSSDDEEYDDDEEIEREENTRNKRQKLDVVSSITDVCTHPDATKGLCNRCGEKMDENFGVVLPGIHEGFKVSTGEEIERLRDKDLRNLLRHKKIYLVLDLDHTLLHSKELDCIDGDDAYLKGPRDDLPDALKTSLHRVSSNWMMTKLRPFVHSFLKEASEMFEMLIYTAGTRDYALEMAKLLDPEDVYFNSRVIYRLNDTQKGYQKRLDDIMVKESAVLILDDTEIWRDDPENLILMDRYHFFASLSRLRRDECETNGALARVLKKIHCRFFDTDHIESLVNRDVRLILRDMRKEVLKGCKILLTRIGDEARYQYYRKLAVQMGATCSTMPDKSITHVVSEDSGAEKSRWAVREKKFLVSPKWIDAARYLWQRQPEEKYPVGRATKWGLT